MGKVADRLREVYIDNRSFEKVIQAYDSPETLFYLDPPYWINGQKFYTYEFSPADHAHLRDVLSAISGKFVLSYNDCSEVRNLYRGFKLQSTAPVHYCLNNKRSTARKRHEIIIRKI